jgi:hypothetical protein
MKIDKTISCSRALVLDGHSDSLDLAIDILWRDVSRGPDIKEARRSWIGFGWMGGGFRVLRSSPFERPCKTHTVVESSPQREPTSMKSGKNHSIPFSEGVVREVIEITLPKVQEVIAPGGGGSGVMEEVLRKENKEKQDGHISGGNDLLRFLKSTRVRTRTRTNTAVEMTPANKTFPLPELKAPLSKLRVDAPAFVPAALRGRIPSPIREVDGERAQRLASQTMENQWRDAKPDNSLQGACGDDRTLRDIWFAREKRVIISQVWEKYAWGRQCLACSEVVTYNGTSERSACYLHCCNCHGHVRA